MNRLSSETELQRIITLAEARLGFIESDNMLTLPMDRIGEGLRPGLAELFRQELEALGALNPERLSVEGVRAVAKSFHRRRVELSLD